MGVPPVISRKILLRFMMGVGGHLHTGDEDASPSSAFARFAGRHPDGGQNKVQFHTGDIVVSTDTWGNPFKHRDGQAGNARMNLVKPHQVCVTRHKFVAVRNKSRCTTFVVHGQNMLIP